ncbi:MAG TPA: hypothetical protein VGM57_01925 [Pseudolabrys sp.]|jgi:hypothetical protein
MLRLIAALVIAAFAVASSPPPAQAKEQISDPVNALSAAKKKQRHVARRDGGGQIACTVYGCHRISRRCTPTTEFDFWGNPTGFDAVACR